MIPVKFRTYKNKEIFLKLVYLYGNIYIVACDNKGHVSDASNYILSLTLDSGKINRRPLVNRQIGIHSEINYASFKECGQISLERGE